MQIDNWLDEQTDKMLTVGDVLSYMHTKAVVRLVVFDRNWKDVCLRDNQRPLDMFKNTMVTIKFGKHIESTRKPGMPLLVGDWKWDFVEDWMNAKELEIEYIPKHWYPLQDGHLPPRDPQRIARFHFSSYIPWTDFSNHVKVGWRGPMIPVSRIRNDQTVLTMEHNK